MKNVTFNNKDSVVFNALKQKVQAYFKSSQKKTTGNFELYLKTVILITTAVSSYITLVFFTPVAWVSILLCVLLGSNIAAIGFNVMHDGAHGSYSSKKWVNSIMAYTLNAVGGTSYFWKIKHNILHHTFTNIDSADDDINISPWLHLHPDQPKRWYHRFQHFYFWFFYGFTYISWILYEDVKVYITRQIGSKQVKQMSFKQHVIFWVSKLSYIGVFVVFPVFMVGLLPTLLGYGILIFTCGMTLSLVFQLAHVVEDTEIPVVGNGIQKIEQEWAIHQLMTTANFATKSKVVTWLLGGLNFQVEHHLFPKINHVHYPHISKLVKATCLEFGITYNEYPTVLSALRSHVLQLKHVAR